MKNSDKICMSFCDGFCGMYYDEEDLDTVPSSSGGPEEADLCFDDGENKGCTEFFWENPEDADDWEENQ